MNQINTQVIARKLEKLSNSVVSKRNIPLITKLGILIGSYIIKPKNNKFEIYKNSRCIYTTYSKTAAMVIAQMLTNNISGVSTVLENDRRAASAREDLEIFKHHYNIAEKNNNILKKDLMMSKFEAADERYQQCKKMLQESYYNLF
jgi:hypothetical protein